MTTEELQEELITKSGGWASTVFCRYVVDVVIPREREAAVDQYLEDQMEQVHKELCKKTR